MSNRSNLNERFRELVLLFVTLGFLAIILEVGARMLTDTQPNLRQRDALIGYRYARSTSADIYVEEADRTVRMRFNNVGFRGPDYTRENPANVTRIAFLGDSMVAALQVDETDSMVFLLEQMLNSVASENRWEVMNFGMSGASPGQAIAVWREEVIHFNPDIVLLGYFVGNDLANNCKCLGSARDRIYFDIDDDGVYRQQPNSEPGVALSQFLNRNSRLYVWQKSAFRPLKQLLRGGIQNGQPVRLFEAGNWIYSQREDPDIAYAWKLTGEAVKTLHREVTAQGARFAVVMVPHGPQIFDDLFDDLISLQPDLQGYFSQDYPDRRLGELARVYGVPFFSMLDDFRAAAPGRSATIDEELLFFHGGLGHFNEKGNLIAAQSVYKFLKLRKAAGPVRSNSRLR